MALTQKGMVYSVGATESRQYKDKTFVSRALVIEQPSYDPYTGEKRSSNFIKLEATRDDTCKVLDSFPVGTVVEVEFIVRGSKYAKKDGSGEDVFTRLELKGISRAGGAPVQQQTANASPIPTAKPAPAPEPSPVPDEQGAGDYDADLGF